MRLILLALLFSFPALVHADKTVTPSERSLKICVSSDAPQAVKDAANQVLAAVSSQPLLTVLAGATPPSALTDSEALMKGPLAARAYNHVIVVGLPDDPIIQAAWQREALIGKDGIYIFGFGNLESDRNPFLHSIGVKTTPYETEIVSLTGTTPEGVRQAVAAFLAKGLINGVVAGPGWARGAPTLLDHDPLAPDFSPPSVPLKVGNATCIGVTSANESEYRGLLENAGVKPLQIWRFKYYVPGVWDGAGTWSSIPQFLAGLHRGAFDNTLLAARFSSEAEAASAAERIGTGSNWKKENDGWTGTPAPLPKSCIQGPEARIVRLWSKDDFVFISTLPDLDSTTHWEK